MTPHFSLGEFIASDIAVRHRINNTLPDGLFPAAKVTLEMMERIRSTLCQHAGRDIPINITSGYRCGALNKAAKGSKKSDHMVAAAVDWRAPSFGSPYEAAKFLAQHITELGIGQLIHEFGSWVHTSTKFPIKALDRIITITHSGTTIGIVYA